MYVVTKRAKGEPVYVVGHTNPDTDSVCSAIAYAHFLVERHQHHVIPAIASSISKETKFVLKYFKQKKPILLKDAKNKNIVIVDHNEIHQSVKNIRQANILEIIDHHRIGDVETIHPIPFENEPRGSTTSIIADRYSWFRIPISRKMAGLLLAGLLSDTILLKSPTTTRKDRALAKKLAKIARVNMTKFGRQMLQEGCSVIKHSAHYILTSDFKTYHRHNKKVGIGQVTVANTKEMFHKRKKILLEMKRLRKKKHFEYVFLMVTNIVSMQTDLLCIGEDDDKALERIEKVFNKKIHNHTMILKKTLSRKKQIEPKVLKLL